MSFAKVATTTDLWEGEMTAVTVSGTRVLLIHTADGFGAFLDRCAHQGVALSEGRLEGRLLVCRAHGWSYDALTGRGKNPETACLTRVPLRVEGDAILVDLAHAGAAAG